MPHLEPSLQDHGCTRLFATAKVTQHVRLAESTYRVRVECPLIARQMVPGQFVMLRLPGCTDPLLGRPFAMYDVACDADGNPVELDLVYLVVGRMTGRLMHIQPGQSLEIWGPLGNRFSNERVDHLIMVAGGIGQTPFVSLGKEALGKACYGTDRASLGLPGTGGFAKSVSMLYGARRASLLAGVDDFRNAGINLKISTDDGSAGHHGFVTDLLREALQEITGSVRVVCCGPEPMMAAVSKIAAQAGVPCQVSLETPMACGLGICFSCVAKILQPDGSWDYKRTCVEGSVFPAEQVVW